MGLTVILEGNVGPASQAALVVKNPPTGHGVGWGWGEGGKGEVGEMYGERNTETYNSICKIDNQMGICCMTQGSQTVAL